MSASSLSASLAECQTPAEVLLCARRRFRTLGVVAVMINNFREFADNASWRPMFSSFPEPIQALYAAHNGHRRDPVMRAALQSSAPVRVRDVLRAHAECPTMARISALCAEHGLVDGLAMVVVSRPGSVNYVGLAFDRSLSRTPLADRLRIHREVEMIARRISALAPSPRKKSLSPKEVEVFARMAAGASNKEIARDLGVAPTTVETLMSRSFGKLQAKSRIEAAVKAARQGLLVAA